MADSKFIILPFQPVDLTWKLLVIVNDEVLPLPNIPNRNKDSKSLEYFLLESSLKDRRKDEISCLTFVDKALCGLGMLYDPTFSTVTSSTPSLVPSITIEMPQYVEESKSGQFVAQSVEVLLEDPETFLGRQNHQGAFNPYICEFYKLYEILLFLLKLGKHAFNCN